jgi:bifunctional pyridoxal-dependent enzyme with beta-cystathionase and maltose regulon repressor activities
MTFVRTEIPDVVIIEPKVHGDERGYFVETFRQDKLEEFFYKDAKLGLSSGTGFGKDSQGFMRINLATPRATVEEAVSRLHSAYESRHF